MKVALVSPMNERTAIAKYSANLAESLTRVADVTLFHDPADTGARFRLPGATFREAGLRGVADFRGFDVVHVQLGDSAFHHFIHHLLVPQWKVNVPLVATFHDAFLNLSLRSTCPSCLAFVASRANRLPALLPRSFKAFLQTGKVHRNLPFRQLCGAVWSAEPDALIFHSKATVQLAVRGGNHPTLLVIPHLAVPSSATPLPVGTGPPLVVAPGLELTERRGLQLLVQALGSCRAPFRLMITGAESAYQPHVKNDILRTAQRFGVAEKIEFAPFVDEATFGALMREAAVVAVPRLASAGEVSSGIIHALTLGKAIVASDIGSFPEYIQDGRSGLLAANDVGSWASALARVLADEDERTRLGRNAASWAEQRLSPAGVANQHEKAYWSLMT